jgi:membrane protein YqaA with SNARE-associated domain
VNEAGRQRLWDAAALLWGFAEATLFFIVPDVLLTARAIDTLSGALRAALFTLVGAVLGGVATFSVVRADPAIATSILLTLPGISEDLAGRTRDLLGLGLVPGMTLGSLTGIPYKLFAFEAAVSDMSLGTFALASVPARGLRFVLVVVLARILSTTVFGRLSRIARLAILAGFWAGLYALYFRAVGW